MSLESPLKLLAPPEMENLAFWATPFLTVGKFLNTANMPLLREMSAFMSSKSLYDGLK